MKNAYFIWAHPRLDSLTAQIVDSMKKRSVEKGFSIKELDLYRSGFNPILSKEDEPQWANKEIDYPQDVIDNFNSLKDTDTVFIVFPIWWSSFPAILKGYIDRVWNYGLAYGRGNRLPVNKIRYIALVGGAKEPFEKREDDKYLKNLTANIASYCGVTDAEIEFLYNTIGMEADQAEDYISTLFDQANLVVDRISN